MPWLLKRQESQQLKVESQQFVNWTKRTQWLSIAYISLESDARPAQMPKAQQRWALIKSCIVFFLSVWGASGLHRFHSGQRK